MTAEVTESRIEEEGTALAQFAKTFLIGNHDQYREAASMVKKCIQYKKFAYDLFEDEKKQAWKLHKSLTAKQKRLQEPFSRSESILRNKIATFILEEKQKAEEKRLSMMEKGQPPVKIDPIPEKEGIFTREVWDYEVINEEIVPDSYKTIDHKKLGQHVRALREEFRCPGVRVYKRESTIIRSA